MTLFLLWVFQVIPAYWQFGLILYAGIYLFRYQQFKSLFHDAMTLGKVLKQFQTVLSFLEGYPYPAGSKLGLIASKLKQPGKSPSVILKKVSRLISAASLQNNQILTLVVNAIIPWDLLFASQLSRYKQTIRHLLPDWLDSWYEFEAYHALANFGYLFPEYQFAELINPHEETKETVFEAKQMGHPLIPLKTRVCNDFGLTDKGQVVIVTGSNMSGKSTFLRTVGINTALALAGAVVPAASLRLQVVRLFTCIQVSDSLNDGFSYFYAEVHRLKQLLDALQIRTKPPVLFLIDEIFRGTNNQERRIGSQAYVRALTKANGAGLISTHDLELSKLAEQDGDILNYNFRDDVVDGRMAFDYILRPGPSPTTNALKIMQLEGLPVK
jgi:DNA mismatch repair ATPase MutS